MRKHFAIKVIWHDGEEEFLKEGNEIAVFAFHHQAKEMAEFMKRGMEGECQSINVVRYIESEVCNARTR